MKKLIAAALRLFRRRKTLVEEIGENHKKLTQDEVLEVCGLSAHFFNVFDKMDRECSAVMIAAIVEEYVRKQNLGELNVEICGKVVMTVVRRVGDKKIVKLMNHKALADQMYPFSVN